MHNSWVRWCMTLLKLTKYSRSQGNIAKNYTTQSMINGPSDSVKKWSVKSLKR